MRFCVVPMSLSSARGRNKHRDAFRPRIRRRSCGERLRFLPGDRRTLKGSAAPDPQHLLRDFSPSRKFDDVVLARSLDQVDAPVPLLKRIGGWIAPGGRLHVVVQNAESLHRRIGKALGCLPSLTHLSAQKRRLGS